MHRERRRRPNSGEDAPLWDRHVSGLSTEGRRCRPASRKQPGHETQDMAAPTGGNRPGTQLSFDFAGGHCPPPLATEAMSQARGHTADQSRSVTAVRSPDNSSDCARMTASTRRTPLRTDV